MKYKNITGKTLPKFNMFCASHVEMKLSCHVGLSCWCNAVYTNSPFETECYWIRLGQNGLYSHTHCVLFENKKLKKYFKFNSQFCINTRDISHKFSALIDSVEWVKKRTCYSFGLTMTTKPNNMCFYASWDWLQDS